MTDTYNPFGYTYSYLAANCANRCLPDEISQDNLCMRAQSILRNSQLQQLEPQQQAQSVCPQGTTLENNLCYPQQQVPTANFTSPTHHKTTPLAIRLQNQVYNQLSRAAMALLWEEVL
jgi:hypothetical protein